MTGLFLRAILLLAAVFGVDLVLRFGPERRPSPGQPSHRPRCRDRNRLQAVRPGTARPARPPVPTRRRRRRRRPCGRRLVTSLPAALVVGAGGAVLARRAGRSVITDAETLAVASSAVTAPLLQSPAQGRPLSGRALPFHTAEDVGSIPTAPTS